MNGISFWIGYFLGVGTGPLAVFGIAFFFSSRDRAKARPPK
jgi:hypothetical protein